MNELIYTKEAVDKRIEVIKKINNWYYDEIPRFNIQGMNQAEFFNHVITIAFNRGIQFAEEKLKERNENGS